MLPAGSLFRALKCVSEWRAWHAYKLSTQLRLPHRV